MCFHLELYEMPAWKKSQQIMKKYVPFLKTLLAQYGERVRV